MDELHKPKGESKTLKIDSKIKTDTRTQKMKNQTRTKYIQIHRDAENEKKPGKRRTPSTNSRPQQLNCNQRANERMNQKVNSLRKGSPPPLNSALQNKLYFQQKKLWDTLKFVSNHLWGCERNKILKTLHSGSKNTS